MLIKKLPFKLIKYCSEPFHLDYKYKYIGTYHKPKGMWFSCEGLKDDFTWKDWCEDAQFNLENLKYRYEIILKPQTKIFHIETVEQLNVFQNKYKIVSPLYKDMVNKCENDPWKKQLKKLHEIMDSDSKNYLRSDLKFYETIDWPSIQKEYDCIMIAPYQSYCRLRIWYNTWDCSSGCIWNLKMIQEMIPLNLCFV